MHTLAVTFAKRTKAAADVRCLGIVSFAEADNEKLPRLLYSSKGLDKHPLFCLGLAFIFANPLGTLTHHNPTFLLARNGPKWALI